MIRTQRHSRFVLMSLDETAPRGTLYCRRRKRKAIFPDRAKRFIFAKLCALAITKTETRPAPPRGAEIIEGKR